MLRGEWERTKPGPQVHGPPLWTGSMDPLFFIPKIIEKRKGKKKAHFAYRIVAVFQLCSLFCFARAIDHFQLPRK